MSNQQPVRRGGWLGKCVGLGAGMLLAAACLFSAETISIAAPVSADEIPRFIRVGNFTMSPRQQLDCSFLPPDTSLHLCVESPPVQVPLMERVYLLEGSKWHRVSTLDQLQGKTAIVTPKMALQFVRLKTSPTTFHTFGPEMEVIPTSELSLELLFGDKSMLRMLKGPRANGLFGVISDQRARQIQVSRPTVEWANGRFTIQRRLVVYRDRSDGDVFKITEEVQSNGEYRELERRPAICSPDIRWYVPLRM